MLSKEEVLSHISVAAGSVVPVDSILLIQLDGHRKVIDGLFKIEEPVPNQPSPIVGGSISFVQFYHLIEILQGHAESVSSHLLPDGSQMM